MARARSLLSILPSGRELPDEGWASRHRFLTWLLVAHVPSLYAYGILRGFDPLHMLLECGAPAAAAAVGFSRRPSRRLRSLAVAFGLITCSALLVHLSGGLIEAHFHFFVMVPLLTLYQSWEPFLLAITYVAVHHGLVGTLSPESVYNHPGALENPWLWAGIHAMFVLAASAFSLVAWRLQEEAVRRQREAAERLRILNQMKDTFLAAVSHELRTPLAAIIGMSFTLERHSGAITDDEARELVVRVGANAHRLDELLADLLDLERLTHGKLEPQREIVEVSSLANDIVRDFPEQQRKLVRIDASAVHASLDRAMMKRILENLLANALKYAPGLPVELRIWTEAHDVIIAVEDLGPGVTDDDKVSIFEPFERGAAWTSHAPGTGIGLSLVARFIELHGGEAWVEDRPGGGASFRVRFDDARAAVPQAGVLAS